MRLPITISLLAVFTLIGCGDDDVMAACVPGTTQQCFCEANVTGVQSCTADGAGFGACVCGESDGGMNMPDGTVPDSSPGMDSNVPDAIVPDAIVPDAIDGSVPDAIVPDAIIPDAIVADAIVVDAVVVTPDMSVPDMNVPDMNVPDMNVPDMNVPDMNVPDMTIQMCGNLAGMYTINLMANQPPICGQLVPNGSVVTATQMGNDVDIDFAGGMQSCTLDATCQCNTTAMFNGIPVMVAWDTTMNTLVASALGMTCNYITSKN